MAHASAGNNSLVIFCSSLIVLLFITPVHASTDVCQACDDSGSAYCLQLVDPGKYGDSLTELHELLLTPNTNGISSKTLRDLFKEPNDPCERSDTKIQDNMLTNFGSGCFLRTSVSFVAGESIPIKITIPADLLARMTKTDNVLTFSAIGLPIFLDIKDIDLQADWGGVVNEVILTNSYARIPRTNSCIQYKFHR